MPSNFLCIRDSPDSGETKFVLISSSSSPVASADGVDLLGNMCLKRVVEAEMATVCGFSCLNLCQLLMQSRDHRGLRQSSDKFRFTEHNGRSLKSKTCSCGGKLFHRSFIFEREISILTSAEPKFRPQTQFAGTKKAPYVTASSSPGSQICTRTWDLIMLN